MERTPRACLLRSQRGSRSARNLRLCPSYPLTMPLPMSLPIGRARLSSARRSVEQHDGALRTTRLARSFRCVRRVGSSENSAIFHVLLKFHHAHVADVRILRTSSNNSGGGTLSNSKRSKPGAELLAPQAHARNVHRCLPWRPDITHDRDGLCSSSGIRLPRNDLHGLAVQAHDARITVRAVERASGRIRSSPE